MADNETELWAVTCVRLDNGFATHPKVVAAGPLAQALFVAGLCHANRYATDGHISSTQLEALLPAVRRPQRYARRLVDVGLWHQSAGGYVIHDYADYQLTSAELDLRRERERLRKRRQRLPRSADTMSRWDTARSPTDQLEESVSFPSVSSLETVSSEETDQSDLSKSSDDFPLQLLLGEVRDANSRTASALRTLRRQLPEAAFHGMREKLRERRGRRDLPPLASEARYVVRSLANEARERNV
jgi:hypothetical protein